VFLNLKIVVFILEKCILLVIKRHPLEIDNSLAHLLIQPIFTE